MTLQAFHLIPIGDRGRLSCGLQPRHETSNAICAAPSFTQRAALGPANGQPITSIDRKVRLHCWIGSKDSTTATNTIPMGLSVRGRSRPLQSSQTIIAMASLVRGIARPQCIPRLRQSGGSLNETGVNTVALYMQRLLRRDNRFDEAISSAVLLSGSAKCCLVRGSNVDDFFEFCLVDPTGQDYLASSIGYEWVTHAIQCSKSRSARAFAIERALRMTTPRLRHMTAMATPAAQSLRREALSWCTHCSRFSSTATELNWSGLPGWRKQHGRRGQGEVGMRLKQRRGISISEDSASLLEHGD